MERGPRRRAVLDVREVVLTNLGEDEFLDCEAVENPEDPDAGTRPLRLGRRVWIEREDFRDQRPRNRLVEIATDRFAPAHDLFKRLVLVTAH